MITRRAHPLGDLVQRSEEQMLHIENFGIKSLEEIRQFLNEHNLHFGMKLEEGEDGDANSVRHLGSRTLVQRGLMDKRRTIGSKYSVP